VTRSDDVIHAAEEVATILEACGVGAVVPLPHLVALKLYAGGMKSRADIVELLSRNPDGDMAEIRELCDRWRLRGLDGLIAEAAGGE
jgi:hypothetical protein